MIDSYSFGSINIDGKTYRSDVIVYPDRVNPKWWRETGHLLKARDLLEVFDFKPEVLVIGTGASGLMKVAEELKKKLGDESIKYVIKRTFEAVKEFNNLSQTKRTVGAFHITC
ncbi:MAG: Mth938-like domain-containing protein [Actinomycetota bacterium]